MAAAAAGSTARADGSHIVDQQTYNLTYPDWPRVMAELAAAKPSVIILASHIADGVAFRKAMVAAGLKVQALIGSTMAECTPDFAGELGADAIGDLRLRPPDRRLPAERPRSRRTGPLRPPRRGLGRGQSGRLPRTIPMVSTADPAPIAAPVGAPEQPPVIVGPIGETSAGRGTQRGGPVRASRRPGRCSTMSCPPPPAFATAGHALSPTAIAAAARVARPAGGQPAEWGRVRFSTAPGALGQNLRAAAVIWQWQAVQQYPFVWPPTYATGSIKFVPLSR